MIRSTFRFGTLVLVVFLLPLSDAAQAQLRFGIGGGSGFGGNQNQRWGGNSGYTGEYGGDYHSNGSGNSINPFDIINPILRSIPQQQYRERYQEPRTIYRDRYIERPTQQAAPPPPPVQNKVPVKEVEPEPNPVAITGPNATAGDVRGAENEAIKAANDMLASLMESMSSRRVNRNDILAMMAASNIDQDTQLLIAQAVTQGNAGQVQLLWAQATKDFAKADELFQQLEMQRTLDDLEAMVAAGQFGQRDLFNTRRTLARFNLTPRERAALATTMDALEGVGLILDAIGSARPGAGLGPVPPGVIEVIYTPSLPPGQVANLGNGYWLVGIEAGGGLSLGRTNIAGAMGYPVYDPAELYAPGGKPLREGVRVYNPADTKTPVSYSLNGAHSYTMDAGQSQHLPGGNTWKIKFHRGGKYGEREYALTEGGYRFGATAEGWELYRESYTVVIDNSAGRTEFNFVSDNKPGKIAPGQKVEITSEYPIAVSYDRGDGQKITNELANNSQAYVGLAADTSLWGLFQSNQAASY